MAAISGCEIVEIEAIADGAENTLTSIGRAIAGALASASAGTTRKSLYGLDRLPVFFAQLFHILTSFLVKNIFSPEAKNQTSGLASRVSKSKTFIKTALSSKYGRTETPLLKLDVI